MQKTRAIIIFRELNAVNLIVALVLGFFMDVYCLGLKGRLSRQRIIPALNMLNIRIVDRSEYPVDDLYSKIRIKHDLSCNILKKLFHHQDLYFRLIETVLSVGSAFENKREKMPS